MTRKFVNVGTVKRICPVIPVSGDNFGGDITMRDRWSFSPSSTPYAGWRNRAAGSIAPFAYQDFLLAPIEPIPPGMELGSVLSRMYFAISRIEYLGFIQDTAGFALAYEARIGQPIVLPEGINPFTQILPWQQVSPPLGTDYQQTNLNTQADRNKWKITSGTVTLVDPVYNDTYVSNNGIPYEYNYGYWKDDVRIFPDDIPTYLDLVTGYSLDPRTIPQVLDFTPTFSGSVNIQYYRRNKDEGIPNLISLDYQSFSIEVTSGIQVTVDVSDIVIGTFSAIPDIYPINIKGKYPWELMKYAPANTANIFALWRIIYKKKYPDITNVINIRPKHSLRVLTANNNIWNNNSTVYSDINYDPNHPLFVVDNQRAYDWHIAPQTDNSIGTLIMDSPRIIDTLTLVNQNKASLAALEVSIDAIKLKVDSLVNTPATDTSTLATSASLSALKAVVDSTKLKVDSINLDTGIIKGEIL